MYIKYQEEESKIFTDTKLQEKIMLLGFMASANGSVKKYYDAIVNPDLDYNIYTEEDLSIIFNAENILEILTPVMDTDVLDSFHDNLTISTLENYDGGSLILTDLELFGLMKKYKNFNYYSQISPDIIKQIFTLILPSMIRDEMWQTCKHVNFPETSNVKQLTR